LLRKVRPPPIYPLPRPKLSEPAALLKRKCTDFRSAEWIKRKIVQYRKCVREILKRAHLTRGSAALAPLKSASFVSFLTKQERHPPEASLQYKIPERWNHSGVMY